MPDPVSRLQLAQVEIDKVLGDGYARANPQVVSAVMIAASLDWAACRTTVRAWCGRKVWCSREMSVDVSFDPAHGYIGTPLAGIGGAGTVAQRAAEAGRGPARGPGPRHEAKGSEQPWSIRA
jgi:hypothetical protein